MSRQPAVLYLWGLLALLFVACGSSSSGANASAGAVTFVGSWEQTLTLASSSCGGMVGEQVVEPLVLAQVDGALQVAPNVTLLVVGRRATWTTIETVGSVRTTRAVVLDLATDGNTFTGTVEDEVLDQSSTPPSRCTEVWSVAATRVLPADFVGVWDLQFVVTASTCGVALGAQLQDQLVLTRINGELLLAPDNPAVLAGRTLQWNLEVASGGQTTALTAEVVMAADNQSFAGTASRHVVDPGATPPVDCVDEFDLMGQRGEPLSLIALRDYLPMQDGDVYVYDDDSSVVISNDGATLASIDIAIEPVRLAPVLTLKLREDAMGGLDLTGQRRSEDLPPSNGSTDAEVYYLSGAGATTDPITGLFPGLLMVGDEFSGSANYALGFVGGSGSTSYYGTSDRTVRYGRSAPFFTPLGIFPDVIRMAVSEQWRRDNLLSNPGSGRQSSNSEVVLWLARGYGPIAVDAGREMRVLKTAVIGGIGF
tara:strand:- start:77007 stop:78449 length:1443 start_codon:yes stop_codon:yes gene_type:complete